MTREVASSLVASGLDDHEGIEHVTWGGELPTWGGMRRTLAQLGRSTARTAKELRAEQAIAGVAVFGLVAGMAFIGVPDAADLLTRASAPSAPLPSQFGFLLVSTRTRLIVLEVHRLLVDPPRGRFGARTFVGVQNAFWWTRPIAPSVPVEMSERRILWKRVVTLTFLEDGSERRLSFPSQPGMPKNLEEARAIARVWPEKSAR